MSDNLYKTISTCVLTAGACFISYEVINNKTPFLCEYDIESKKLRFGMNGGNPKTLENNQKVVNPSLDTTHIVNQDVKTKAMENTTLKTGTVVENINVDQQSN